MGKAGSFGGDALEDVVKAKCAQQRLETADTLRNVRGQQSQPGNHRLWRRDCLNNDCLVSTQMRNCCWPKGVVITINKLSGLQLLLQLQSTVKTTSYDAFVIYVIHLAFNDGYYVACQWSDKYVGQCK